MNYYGMRYCKNNSSNLCEFRSDEFKSQLQITLPNMKVFKSLLKFHYKYIYNSIAYMYTYYKYAYFSKHMVTIHA
jgi:hypothetical protein